MSAIGLVLLFLLTVSTNNRAMYERNYAWLFGLNVLVALLLFAVLAWVAVRLAVRLRKGRFGSRLLVKLAGIFGLVGLVPGLLIYVVSYQFVSRSIESWFDVKVEGALSAGVSLARATLDTLASDMAAQARTASIQLAPVPDAAAGLVLERIRDQLGATDVVLFNSAGQAVASAGQSRFDLNPERPAPQLLRNARQQRSAFQIEGLDEAADPQAVQNARVKTLVMVGTTSVGLLEEPRYLQATMRLPQVVVANALAVQEANREYQERALARGGLRRMYIGTLTLSLFLAVFGAVLLAVLLGRHLARPLLVLAEGVREVASGNLSPKAVLQTGDELGGLTRSFAVMTQQLADARSAVERSMGEVDAARAPADHPGQPDGRRDRAGRAGPHPVHQPGCHPHPACAHGGVRGPAAGGGAGAGGVRGGRAGTFRRLPGRPRAAARAGPLAAPVRPARGGRGSHPCGAGRQRNEPGGAGRGAARRAAAAGVRRHLRDRLRPAGPGVGEVARRLAHEIKNPLTPIQLSAERLEMKLTGKLGAAEEAVLAKSVKTIVDQVDAMKRLVNEFRDYARLPAAELQRLDLNALVGDILHLYGAETATVPVESELDPRCPAIAGDAQQLRQVIHNLLQNAQDASEQRAREEGWRPPRCASPRAGARPRAGCA